MADQKELANLTSHLHRKMHISLQQSNFHDLASTDQSRRKASVQKLTELLNNDGVDPETTHQIQATLLKMCEEVFHGPRKEAASPLLATVNSKIRSKQLDQVEASVMSSFCLLLSLTNLFSSFQGEFMGELLDRLWIAVECRIPELSIKAFDFFKSALYSPSAEHLSVVQVESHLSKLLHELEVDQRHDWKFSVALTEAIHSSFLLLHKKDLSTGVKHLPLALKLISRRLLDEHGEVRDKSQSSVNSLMRTYLSVETHSPSMSQSHHIASLTTAAQSLHSMLTEESIDSLQQIRPVITTFFKCLGREFGSLASPILTQLDHHYKMIQQPNTELVTDTKQDVSYQVFIERLIASAVFYLGSKQVLSMLPLLLKEVLVGQTDEEPRTWLLPIMKRSVYSDSLMFWIQELFPLTNLLKQKAQNLENRDGGFEFKCQVLEMQIWGTLPSFCRMPVDAAEAYTHFSHVLRKTFIEQTNLQDSIALAVSRLWHHSKSIITVMKERSEWTGKSVQDLATLLDIESNLFPCGVSLVEIFDAANQAMDCFKKDGLAWFEVLTESFLSRHDQISRNHYDALRALANTFESDVFKSLAQKLMIKLPEVFVDPAKTSEQGAYMDLLYILLESMDTIDLQDVIRLVEIILKSEVGLQCQKKAYKLLAYILEYKHNAWISKSKEMCLLLEATNATCHQSSLQFRLACIGELLVTVLKDGASLASISKVAAAFVPEIVMAFEAATNKVEEVAKFYLKKLAESYSQRGNFHILIESIKPGLSSHENEMIIATIKALSCLVRAQKQLCSDYLPDILKTILQITHEKHRLSTPFVKAVVQFLEVAITVLSMADLQLHLGQIMNFLLGGDAIPMKKVQTQTKELLSQLGDQMTFKALEGLVPETFSRVMRNLRSAHVHRLRRNEEKSERESTKMNETFGSRSKTLKNTQTVRKGAGSALTKLMNLSVQDAEEGEDMRNLLDPFERRRLARAAANPSEEMEMEEDPREPEFKLPVNEDGRIIISNRTLKQAERRMSHKTKKEKERILGSESGLSKATTKKIKEARSKQSKSQHPTTSKSHVSGRRFKAKKGAGGDAKGHSRFEPFAYWKLDRRLLNKRKMQQKAARHELTRITK